jgi:RNA polymerase sigma factor (sigma-70 family)
LIKRNSGTEENARDIFQEAMIIFYEKVLRTDFELTASVQTYLYAVSRNLWLKFLRDNRREIPVDLQDQKSENLMRDENPFFKNDRVNTLTKSVHQYLDKLGNPCRKILIYYYYFKLSMDDIAERLGYSNSNSVKSQKYKCIERLKKTVPDNLKTLLYTN